MEDTWTGEDDVRSEKEWLYTSVEPLYHLRVRYWTGAMFWTSQSSWYSFPSTIGPVWLTGLMETLSGVSGRNDTQKK